MPKCRVHERLGVYPKQIQSFSDVFNRNIIGNAPCFSKAAFVDLGLGCSPARDNLRTQDFIDFCECNSPTPSNAPASKKRVELKQQGGETKGESKPIHAKGKQHLIFQKSCGFVEKRNSCCQRHKKQAAGALAQPREQAGSS